MSNDYWNPRSGMRWKVSKYCSLELMKLKQRLVFNTRPEPDIPPPPYALELAPISEIISRNSMTIFGTNYRRFCTKYETILPQPKLVPKIRWIVRDRAKFGGLINVLKEIVDDLFSLLKLEKSVHEEAIELEILENIDTLELRLVEDAAEASFYTAFARAASIAIERNQNGTIDRRAVTMSQAPSGTIIPGPATLNQLQNQKTSQIDLSNLDTAKLFFMVTPLYRSYAGSCIDEIFERWPSMNGYESSLSPEPIWMRMLRQINISDCLHQDNLEADLSNARKVDEDGKWRKVEALASGVVVVAPCFRLVTTAAFICRRASGAKARLLSFHICVDDLLNCSCSDPDANQHRLGALVSYWRRSKAAMWTDLHTILDLTRMEQRVYELQQDLPPSASVGDLDHLFDEVANQVDLTMPVAAILVIGEDHEIVRIFQKLPLVPDPRMPTAGQFFSLLRSRWQVKDWRRHFLGSYTLEPNLRPQVAVLNANDPVACSPLHFRPISPTSQASHNKKHRLSTQGSSVASKNSEPQEGVGPRVAAEPKLSSEEVREQK